MNKMINHSGTIEIKNAGNGIELRLIKGKKLYHFSIWDYIHDFCKYYFKQYDYFDLTRK